jgi:hypothetical protein
MPYISSADTALVAVWIFMVGISKGDVLLLATIAPTMGRMATA